MGAIDDDLQPLEAQPARKRALSELDAAAQGIVQPPGAAKLAGGRKIARAVAVQPLLDGPFDLVGKFVAVGAEEFDAVVLERIVRGRDHDAEIGPE
jgi:hypothetical protein